ncbi:MAG TPA: protein kinase [Thermoanaerobaculia bacterium]|jgi:putative methionine-R-sulfoxide reductase with GAF domain/predicted Ser/Thr protein kinase
MPRESERPTQNGKRTPGADKPLKAGTLLGDRYRIDRVLGFGGMGVVYRARDLRLDTDIALKRIRPDRMSPERRETLRREIILSRRVTHPNVCRVFDLVEIGGEDFVSMEFLPGRTLKEIEDDEKTLPLGRGLSIAKGICGGLAAAHRIGVLHRDLKPENVIVTQDGVPHLMDFGIAVEQAHYEGGKEETVPGTPQFLAPELLRGDDPSMSTDVYAMGVLLYEMFTGRVPFDDNDTARLVRRVLAEAPPKAQTLRPDLPPELLSILDRAVAKDPAARFSDAETLSESIARFEGQVLDRVLAEVSVTRAKMVKLMVILEANKSLAATFDPTETLRIILRTATSETNAERGTIFLRAPGTDELVSQILEGGAVQPFRLRVGHGIAGTVAQTGATINTGDAYGDPRFHANVDAASGFHTQTILAVPMRTPGGEIVGVVEILNKRSGVFTKEDEEFLQEVGTHAAIAVEGVRQHEAAVARARREGAEAVARGAAALLAPGAWPETPGFESAPLRWGSEEWNPIGYGVDASAERLAFLLVEDPREPEEAFGPLLKAVAAGRPALASAPPAEVVARVLENEPAGLVAAAAWTGDRLSVAAAGTELPLLLREGRPVPGPAASDGRISSAEYPTAPGDLLIIASRGLADVRFPARPIAPDDLLVWLARESQGRPIVAGFAKIVADGKKMGAAPGPRDVLLLAARRLR